ncbi:MAG: ISAs1 family transposase [Parachlamydiaceae bacterium]|nr:ISAs1 family transposase [Parachlamydiaceae bacterium]
MKKPNEITAIPQLLDMIDIKGATITIDAAGCQKKIITQIDEGEVDYVVAVKENQPLLYAEIVQTFEAAHAENFYYVPNGI